MQNVAPDDTYSVEMKVDQAAVLVTSSSEPKMVVTVTLSSPLVRESLLQESSGGKFYIPQPLTLLKTTLENFTGHYLHCTTM